MAQGVEIVLQLFALLPRGDPCEYEHFVSHQSPIGSAVEPGGIYDLCRSLRVAVVEFSAYHCGIWRDDLHGLRVLQSARPWFFIYSRPLVALSFGCVWSVDSGGVLNRHVLDGVQQAGLVGVAFRCCICYVGLVWHSDFASGALFLDKKTSQYFTY
jgi:hypothetical protein